jgi:hypothetical protein
MNFIKEFYLLNDYDDFYGSLYLNAYFPVYDEINENYIGGNG